MNNLSFETIMLAKTVQHNGLASVIGPLALTELRRTYQDRIPTSWVEHCADELGLSPSSNALTQATDLWLTHRLSDRQISDDVLPILQQTMPAGVELELDQAIQLWRGLYKPMQAFHRPGETHTQALPVNPTNPSQLKKILKAHFGENAIEALLNHHRLHIIESISDLPSFGDQRLSSEANRIAAATYPDGSVYLVANRISAASAVGIFLHEVGEHAGLSKMLGDDYGRLQQHFRRLMVAGDHYAQHAAMRVPLSTPDEHVPSEQLAYLIEQVANDQVAAAGGEEGFDLGQQCLSHLRAWMFKTPLVGWLESVGAADDFNMRPQDIAALARQAVASLANTPVEGDTPAWIGQLDADHFQNLFLETPLKRHEMLSEASPEALAGYLYGLQATRAPDIGLTLDSFIPQLTRMAEGVYGQHLSAIAGEVLAATSTEALSLHLEHHLNSGGVAMARLGGPSGNGQLFVITRDGMGAPITVHNWLESGGYTCETDVPPADVLLMLTNRAIPVHVDDYAPTLERFSGTSSTAKQAAGKAAVKALVNGPLFAVDQLFCASADTVFSLAEHSATHVEDYAVEAIIRAPAINDPHKANVTGNDLFEALGQDAAIELFMREEKAVYGTPIWQTLSEKYAASTVSELVSANPALARQLEIPAHQVFSKEQYRVAFANAGFDGAIYQLPASGTVHCAFDKSQVAPVALDNPGNETLATAAEISDLLMRLVEADVAYNKACDAPSSDGDLELLYNLSLPRFDLAEELANTINLSSAKGIEGKTTDGRQLMLTPSSKRSGYWQLTRFDFQGNPLSDTLLPTKKQGTEYMLEEATPASLMVYGVGPAVLNATPGQTHGIKFSFAGTSATTAAVDDLLQAKKMMLAGAKPENVWLETGWMKGRDDQWRFEIDDSAARLAYENSTITQQYAAGARVIGDLLDHPILFKHYPVLADIPFESSNRTELSSYPDSSVIVRLDSELSGNRLIEALLHELQHAVQLTEGFELGGSPKDFTPLDTTSEQVEAISQAISELMQRNPVWANRQRYANRLFDHIRDQYGFETDRGIALKWEKVDGEQRAEYFALLDELAQHAEYETYTDLELERKIILANPQVMSSQRQYWQLMGEVEARNVEVRRTLSDVARRLVYPEQTADVTPANMLIQWRRPASKPTVLTPKVAADASPRFSVIEDIPESWHYSALQRAVERIDTIADKNGELYPQQAQAWLNSKQKSGAFKKDELHWSGLIEWLGEQSGKVSTLAIKGYVAANSLPLEEAFYGDSPDKKGERPAIYKGFIASGDLGYRELLLTIPRAWRKNEMLAPEHDSLPSGFEVRPVMTDGTKRYGVFAGQYSAPVNGLLETPDAAMVSALNYINGNIALHNEIILDTPLYQSSHWNEANVLLHLRLSDRVDQQGRASLFVEEIQSDWAQQGRREGFGSDAIAEAPFVMDTKSWVGLAVRRVMAYAADNGYESVAFVNGHQAALRAEQLFKLSSLSVERGHNDFYRVTTYDSQEEPVVENQTHTYTSLVSTFGKKLAIELGQLEPGFHTIKAPIGFIGGEGMIRFYDELLPQVVRSTLKQLGAGALQEIDLGFNDIDFEATQIGVAMVPALTQKIRQAGQPLFSMAEDSAVYRASVPSTGQVLYCVQQAAQDDELALFDSGIGSLRFTDFGAAWERATASDSPTAIAPASVTIAAPVPRLSAPGERLVNLAMLPKVLGAENAAKITAITGNADLTPQQLFSNPHCVEVFKDAGYDGACYKVDEKGRTFTERAVFTTDQITLGRSMAVTTPTTGARLSMSGSVAASKGRSPTPSQPAPAPPLNWTKHQPKSNEMGLVMRLDDLPGYSFANDDIQALAAARNDLIAKKREEIKLLESRERFVESANVPAEHLLTLTRNKLRSTTADLAALRSCQLPSRHNTLEWDKPIGSGIRKALQGVIYLQDSDTYTGKQLIWLAAATHGGYTGATAALSKAGIKGVSDNTETLLWDQHMDELIKHLPNQDAGVRFHLAYHGSPHQFDSFSNEYLGTGEGAQAYGLGLYLADTVQTASHYQKMAAKKQVLYGHQMFTTLHQLATYITGSPETAAQAPAGSDASEVYHEVATYLNMRAVSHSYAESYAGHRPNWRPLFDHITQTAIFYDHTLSEFGVLPADGSVALNEIQHGEESELRMGMHAITSTLGWFLRKDMTDDELQQAFDDHIANVTDVEQARELVTKLEGRSLTPPTDDFTLDQLRDAKWSLYTAQCAEDLVERFGPLKPLRPVDPGHIYLVDIDLQKDDYLGHDVPFAEQPKAIQDALNVIASGKTELPTAFVDQLTVAMNDNAKGADLYRALFTNPAEFHHNLADEKSAVDQLLREGVRGIKYWDGHTRQNEDQKNFNYVVFDSGDLTVLGRENGRVFGQEHFDSRGSSAPRLAG
mgnify:CR=1 FL=1